MISVKSFASAQGQFATLLFVFLEHQRQDKCGHLCLDVIEIFMTMFTMMILLLLCDTTTATTEMQQKSFPFFPS